jgi:hypothetical protein
MPAFQRRTAPNGAIEFVSRNQVASVSIMQEGPAIHYTLNQNGAAQPCTTTAGRPHEFDLFANTGGPVKNPMMMSALTPAEPGAKSPSLGQMARLDQHVVARIVSQTTSSGSNHGCRVNQGNVLTAVTLANTDARPPQVLFYQLSLHVICGDGQQKAACKRNLARPFFWWTGEQSRDSQGRPGARSFGYDQRLPHLGQSFLPVGAARTVDIDLLPDLLRLITSKAHGLDPDPAHWRVSDAYHGQSVWGDVSLQTEWSDYSLTAILH